MKVPPALFPAPLAGVTVAHFGHFDPLYSRNRILAKALRRAGATVVTVDDRRSFRRRAVPMTRALVGARPDVVLVGFPGHADVGLARLATRVPVLFDAFTSLLETAVEDRGLVRPRSPAALRYGLEDRTACRLATRVVVDTDAHGRYFAERHHADASRIRRVWVGADDDVVKPAGPPRGSRFRVFVYGTFIPLHGFEHVVRAARILDADADGRVEFEIVGTGQTEARVRALAAELGVHNVQFAGRRPYPELVRRMADSHVCLGIFGTSGKALRVVPNKVFDALAAARAVVTADTPAARELLTDGETAALCPPGSPEALAETIRSLADDAGRRERIAVAGHELFRRSLSIDAIARDVGALVREVLDGGEAAHATSSRSLRA